MAEMHPFEKLFVNSVWDYLFHKYFGVSQLLKEISQHEAKNILEVGCGIGITTNFISRKFPNSQIIAVDYDESQIEKARKRIVDSRINFLQVDAMSLKFPDNNFDVCFAVFVFHHISEFSKALREIHRVLKKGAKFYIIDIPIKTWNPFHRWIKFHSAGEFTKKEFIQNLEQIGFKLKKSKGNLLFSLDCEKF